MLDYYFIGLNSPQLYLLTYSFQGPRHLLKAKQFLHSLHFIFPSE